MENKEEEKGGRMRRRLSVKYGIEHLYGGDPWCSTHTYPVGAVCEECVNDILTELVVSEARLRVADEMMGWIKTRLRYQNTMMPKSQIRKAEQLLQRYREACGEEVT